MFYRRLIKRQLFWSYSLFGNDKNKMPESISHKDTKPQRENSQSDNLFFFVNFVASCENMINPNQRVAPAA